MVDAKRLCKKEDDGLDEEEEVGVSHKAWSFPFFLNPQIPTRASLVKAAETFLNAKGGLMAKHGKHSRRRKWIVVPDELCSKTLSSITLNCEKIYGFICMYPRGSNAKHLLPIIVLTYDFGSLLYTCLDRCAQLSTSKTSKSSSSSPSWIAQKGLRSNLHTQPIVGAIFIGWLTQAIFGIFNVSVDHIISLKFYM